jgi:hypothetical protein
VPAPDAGTLLAAAEALRTHRNDTWTDSQVAYLMSRAYESGRADTTREDFAEMVTLWEDHRPLRETYEQKVARRREELRGSNPLRREYRGGPVDWNTGAPLRPPTTLDAEDAHFLALAMEDA